jgi:hypothetical protein
MCERVLARMFAHRTAELAEADIDAWTALQWVTGRAEVPGLGRLTEWKWRAAPLDETWNPNPVAAPMRFAP